MLNIIHVSLPKWVSLLWFLLCSFSLPFKLTTSWYSYSGRWDCNTCLSKGCSSVRHIKMPEILNKILLWEDRPCFALHKLSFWHYKIWLFSDHKYHWYNDFFLSWRITVWLYKVSSTYPLCNTAVILTPQLHIFEKKIENIIEIEITE